MSAHIVKLDGGMIERGAICLKSIVLLEFNSPETSSNKVGEHEEVADNRKKGEAESGKSKQGKVSFMGKSKSGSLGKVELLVIEISVQKIPSDRETVQEAPNKRTNKRNKVGWKSEQEKENYHKGKEEQAKNVDATIARIRCPRDIVKLE